MRTMLYLLAILAGLSLPLGSTLAGAGPASIQLAEDKARGGSLAAGDYEVDEYDPKKHPVDRRNIGNRPTWWWTHPMCRPKWRDLGNCKLDLAKEAPEPESPDR